MAERERIIVTANMTPLFSSLDRFGQIPVICVIFSLTYLLESNSGFKPRKSNHFLVYSTFTVNS